MRFEIVSLGSFPIMIFYTGFVFDLALYIPNGYDSYYMPWPLASTYSYSANLPETDREKRILVALGGCAVVGIIDAVIHAEKIKRSAASAGLEPSGELGRAVRRLMGYRKERDSMGEVRVAAEGRLWGAQTQRSLENLPHRPRAHAHRDRPRPRLDQEGRGHREWPPGRARRGQGRRHRRGLRRHTSARARRPLPPLGLADRLGHADQHERQRGDREFASAQGGRASRLQEAPASERRRQQVPVEQRRLPRRHAGRGGAQGRGRAPARGARPPGARSRPRPRSSRG